MHRNALSAFTNSLPCYGLSYSPLKLVVKTTASYSGLCKIQVIFVTEQNAQIAKGPWLASEQTRAGLEPQSSKDYPGNSCSNLKDYSIDLAGLHVCDRETPGEILQEQSSRKTARHSEQILGGSEASN